MTDEGPPRDSLGPALAASIASIQGARLLIVDDDAVQCSYLAREVEGWGAIALEARTFGDATRLHREGQPDIVLLDVMMPEVDGYKIAQMFKREAPFVPIILLTARDDQIECRRRALAAGADELLPKPFNLVELQIRVLSMLRVKRLADHLAAANERLAALAMVDPLTNVANRRALMERLGHEFARSRRYGKPLACLMVDLDHFKRVNDELGHPMGDKVLAATSKAIAKTIRETDLVGRYGGEEFMVLAPEATLENGAVLGERIRAAIGLLGVREEPPFPRITASIGVATTRSGDPPPDELIARADRALYRAKSGGRNRVICEG